MHRGSSAGEVAPLPPSASLPRAEAETRRAVAESLPPPRLPAGPKGPLPACVPGHCEALLRMLVARSPDFDEIAGLVLRDPGLLFALFEAAPLAGQRLASTLRAEVTRRLETLGADLLRAWILARRWDAPPPSSSARSDAIHALLSAECALHLALETRYPYPDEAYLAGLWHTLGGDDSPAQRNAATAEQNEATLAASLAERCGAPFSVADALAFHHELAEAHLAAHPLVRLLWAARQLAHENWLDRVEAVAEACSLSREALLSLRTDVGYLAGDDLLTAEGPDAQPYDVSGPMRQIVLSGLVRGAFCTMAEEALAPRLAMACRLLGGEAAAPLVLAPDEHEQLQPLGSLAGSNLREWCLELGLRKDDETSVIALAARSATVTTWRATAPSARRSPRDWHVARRLGRGGFVCLPLQLPDLNAVAIVGSDEGAPPPPAALSLLSELAAAAGTAALDMQRRQAASRDGAQRVEQRFREHARRIVHEASNPLSVVRSHLEILAQREPLAAGSREEFALLQDELERIATLLQRAANPASDEEEPASCRVTDVLQELRTVYGETLFERRAIRFELRTATVPPVAMPASALKQVLVNLFRNAAEALQPDGRFAVTVPGMVISNGALCVELRLIDNGPGLPPERLSDLAMPHASSKGGAHQGLGLAIVHEILAKWNIVCLCRSQAGTGTSYQLFIPLAQSS